MAKAPLQAEAFEGRRVLVGVTGGIAAYKTCHVVSRLVQAGAEVTVLMTESAARFVGPETFRALSGRPVFTSPWDTADGQDVQHVDLARSADAAVVAPATMNCLGKLAHGLCDDAVTVALAAVDRATTPVLLAPAMNAAMWAQPSTRRNVERLVADGFTVVGPGEGWQACRSEGAGRMAEPDEVLAALARAVRR
ncbi:MAG: hypothetical protein D6693_02345 [Planctomycetota bacterium]|nr:MAG: hypothetical protein D6693_02345 [Planctomycetota bacterium]